MTPPVPAAAAPPAPAGSRSGGFLRPVLAFGFLLAALVVVYFSPLQSHLREVQQFRNDLRQAGAWQPIVYMLVVMLCTGIGVPRLLFCFLGGFLFGFKFGLLWTQLPTLIGYYCSFCFLRWGGRDFIRRRWPRILDLPIAFGEHAAFKLILIRQIPITGIAINSILAVSPIRHRDFLIGTALGLLPQAIPVTLIGSSTVKAERSDQLFFLGAALVLFLAYLAFRRFARRRSADIPDLTGGAEPPRA